MTNIFENYWGIDVSKAWLDIAIDKRVCRIAQSREAIIDFIKEQEGKGKNILVVLESTGGYERMVVDCLKEASFTVHVAHPNKVKAFARARGRLAKTDKIDAKLLRDYGRFIELDELRGVPSQEQQTLQLLNGRLEQLKAMIHQERCRIGIATVVEVKKSHERMMEVLEEELCDLEKQVLKVIKENPEWLEKYNLLRSMKGVGPVLAMVLIADLPELGSANKKEIAALVGVAPITHQSGQKTGRAMTKYGRRGIRKVLYMAALTACRYNPRMRAFYERLIAAGKLKKVAVVAVMRKMLVILNAMLQTKSYFIP